MAKKLSKNKKIKKIGKSLKTEIVENLSRLTKKVIRICHT